MPYETVFDRGFRKLDAWKLAHELTLKIYRITEKFPQKEMFGMTDQVRRASSSIEAQIAEGSRIDTTLHRKSFYVRAYASAAEVDTFLELARDLNYLTIDEHKELIVHLNKASACLFGLIKSCQ